MEDRLFSALSLCRKAGRLRSGMDAVKSEITSGAAKLVLLAQDLSERSERQIRFACTDHKVRAVKIPLEMIELARITGKPHGIFAVCDAGFAGMITKHLPPEEPAEPSDPSA